MLIDWFTVIAQVINFLILVWLLKRFLYKPILQAIDAREKGIAEQLSQAETDRAEAKKEQDTYQHKNAAFEKERESRLKKAMDEVEAKRQQLIREAEKEVKERRSKLREVWQNEQQTLREALTQRIRKEVFITTRKTLADLASMSLEEHMVEVFMHRLSRWDETTKSRLVVAMETSGQGTVRTAFELANPERQKLEEAIRQLTSADIQLYFEVAPQQISGIEIFSAGYRTAWSISEYLSSLEDRVTELLREYTDIQPETVSAHEYDSH